MLECPIIKMIDLKKAQEQDLPVLTLLWRDHLQPLWTGEMIKSSFEKEDVYTIIAVSKDPQNGLKKCVGFLMGSFLMDAELYAIVVKKDFQKQGIGEALLENFLEFLKNQKISSLFLEVAENNLEARAFYEKMKFQRVGVRPNYFEKKTEGGTCAVNALVLEKKL